MKKFYILMLLSTSYVHSMQGHHNHHHGGGFGGGMMMQGNHPNNDINDDLQMAMILDDYNGVLQILQNHLGQINWELRNNIVAHAQGNHWQNAAAIAALINPQPFAQHHHDGGNAHHNHHHGGGHGGGMMMNNHNHHHGGGGHGGGMMMQGNPGGFQLAPDHGGVGPIILNHNMDPNYIRQLQAEAGFWDLANNRPILPNRRITVRDIRRLLEINNGNRNTAFSLGYYDQYVIDYISSALTNAQLDQEIIIWSYNGSIFFYSPLNYGNLQDQQSALRFDCNILNPHLLNGRQDVIPRNQYQPPAQPAFPEMIPFYPQPQPQHHHAHADAHHNHHHDANGGWMMMNNQHHGGGGHGGGFMGGGGGFSDPVLAPHAQLLNQIGQHNAAQMMAFLLDPQAMATWINNQRQQMDMNAYANFLNVIENQPFFGAEVERFLTRFPIGQMGGIQPGAENVMGGQAEEASFKMALSVMKDAKRHDIDFSEQKFNTLSNTLKTLFKKIVADKKAARDRLDANGVARFKADQEVFIYETALVALGDNNNGTINHYDNSENTYQNPYFMSHQGSFINRALNHSMQNLTLKKAFFYVCEEAMYRLIHDDESAPKQKMFMTLSQLQQTNRQVLSEEFINIKHPDGKEVRRQKIEFDDNAMTKAIKEFIDNPAANPQTIISHLLNFFNNSNLRTQSNQAKQLYPSIQGGVIESFAKPIAQYLHSVVRAHTGDSLTSVAHNNGQLQVYLNNGAFVIHDFDPHETVKGNYTGQVQSLRSYLIQNQNYQQERAFVQDQLQQYASLDRTLRHRASCMAGTIGRVQELISELKLRDAPAIGGQLDCEGNVEQP